MLSLVLSDRHVARVIKKDVGGHQGRIGKKPGARALSLPSAFLFELRHPLQPTHRDEALEDPGQFGMGGNMRLDEHRLLFHDPARQVDGRQAQRVLPQCRRILRDGDGVQVDDAKDVVVLILVPDPVPNGTQVVTEVKATARLDAGEHAGLSRVRLHPRMLSNPFPKARRRLHQLKGVGEV